MKTDSFGALDTLDAGQGPVSYYRLRALEREGLATDLDHLPFSIKVLLESVLRNVDGELVTEADVRRLAAWNAARPAEVELPFMPARVILQDFTGVPAVVDLASMRTAVRRLGVGGMEAEAATLGQPLYMLTPEVVGFRLTGKLREGVPAPVLVLTVTQMLRKKGGVEKFVEFLGTGLGQMRLADRPTIGNMAPE